MILKRAKHILIHNSTGEPPFDVTALCTVVIAWDGDEYDVTVLEQDEEGGTHKIIGRSSHESLQKAEQRADLIITMAVLHKLQDYVQDVPKPV
jgi:hypothetical protein